MTEPEKVCVILGAGASHAVRGIGTTQDQPSFRPPLADSLFNTQNPEFWEIMRWYPGARYIASLLPNDLGRRGGLEDCLRYYADHPTEAMRRHYLHVPPYLRDLLFHCGSEYTPDPSSYIELVNELLAEHSFETMFLILNYDDLLERALTGHDEAKYQFTELGHYIASNRPAKIVKLHGSINWFRSVTRRPNETWEEAILTEDVITKHPDSEIMVIDHIYNTFDGDTGHWLYPILTAPLAGKGPADVVCPRSHFEFAQAFLKECNNYLVIGTSGLDTDLLDLMHDSTSPRVPQFVHFVGEDTDKTKESLERFKARIMGFRRRESTVVQFSDGFRNYLGADLRAFAEQDPPEFSGS